MAGEDALFQRFGKEFKKGDVLFREGEPGKEMYVIQAGKVNITKTVRDTEKILATLGAGEFLGEMAILNNKPRSAGAVVAEDAKLLVIDPKTFEAMIRGNAEIAIRMIKKLAARLAQANSQVETLLKQDLNHRIVRQLRQLADTRGESEAQGVRVDIAIEELAQLCNAGAHDIIEGLERLEKARLVSRQVGSVFIAEPDKLGEFLDFLDLKERFGS